MSTRMAVSITEVGSTLSTWPQLGSDVVHGGASVAVAVRRLALGDPLPSGRRYVDIHALLAEPVTLAGEEGELLARPDVRALLHRLGLG
jgi:hypothetical protein